MHNLIPFFENCMQVVLHLRPFVWWLFEITTVLYCIGTTTCHWSYSSCSTSMATWWKFKCLAIYPPKWPATGCGNCSYPPIFPPSRPAGSQRLWAFSPPWNILVCLPLPKIAFPKECSANEIHDLPTESPHAILEVGTILEADAILIISQKSVIFQIVHSKCAKFTLLRDWENGDQYQNGASRSL